MTFGGATRVCSRGEVNAALRWVKKSSLQRAQAIAPAFAANARFIPEIIFKWLQVGAPRRSRLQLASSDLDMARKHWRRATLSTHSRKRRKGAILEFLNSLVLFPPDDTASNLDPGNSNTPTFPQRGHGSIRLPELFNNRNELE